MFVHPLPRQTQKLEAKWKNPGLNDPLPYQYEGGCLSPYEFGTKYVSTINLDVCIDLIIIIMLLLSLWMCATKLFSKKLTYCLVILTSQGDGCHLHGSNLCVYNLFNDNSTTVLLWLITLTLIWRFWIPLRKCWIFCKKSIPGTVQLTGSQSKHIMFCQRDLNEGIFFWSTGLFVSGLSRV